MGTGSTVLAGRRAAHDAPERASCTASSIRPRPSRCTSCKSGFSPRRRGLPRATSRRPFRPEETKGKLRLVASREGRDGSLTVHQDMQLFAGKLEKGERALSSCLRVARRGSRLRVARCRSTTAVSARAMAPRSSEKRSSRSWPRGPPRSWFSTCLKLLRLARRSISWCRRFCLRAAKTGVTLVGHGRAQETPFARRGASLCANRRWQRCACSEGSRWVARNGRGETGQGRAAHQPRRSGEAHAARGCAVRVRCRGSAPSTPTVACRSSQRERRRREGGTRQKAAVVLLKLRPKTIARIGIASSAVA